MKTVFIPAYDTEAAARCQAACETIVPLHRAMEVPATFFIVTRLLEGAERPRYAELLRDERFEIASHTVNHILIREQKALGLPAAPWETIASEVARSKRTIEDVFERPCEGLRAPCSFEDGLGEDTRLIECLNREGYRYSSSQAWGPQCTLPAPLAQARRYDALGYPDLWEFPGHGWHENVLKGHNATPGRFLLWPPVYPDHLLARCVKTPEEEFAVNRFFIDKAVELNAEFVSLIWHPWSLGRFDPEMTMLRLTFDYVRSLGLPFATYRDLRARRD